MKAKVDLKKISPLPSNESKKEEVLVPVSSLHIHKLSNGMIQYSIIGSDSDVLGLIEFAKLIVSDKARLNIAAGNQQAQPIQPPTPDVA